YSQDFSVFGGSLGEVHGEKITKVMDFALRTGVPIIGISDGGGARIQEGVAALTQFAEIFRRNVAASGVIPQISLILGPSAGGAVYSPALTDFIVMADQTSNMFITGPDVIRTVTGENVGFEELGGGRTHNERSGVAHYLSTDDDDAFVYVRALLHYLPSYNTSDPHAFLPQAYEYITKAEAAFDYVRALLHYLPSNNSSDPEVFEAPAEEEITKADAALDSLVPDSDNQPYDMHALIEQVLDDQEFLEVQPLYAQNVMVGFGHVEGRSVGVVANQPRSMAGTLDIAASEKAARFVRTCDAFNIPVLTFVDVPGFLPGTDQEWNGIIRRGAKLIYAYAEATVPLITVITRKAYGGAYDVMGSKHLGADINIAWPSAQIAVMGAQGAANIVYRKTLANAEQEGRDVEELRADLIQEYEDELCNPYVAAERGYVDTVIPPSHTRGYIARSLRMIGDKRETQLPKKHGNLPL